MAQRGHHVALHCGSRPDGPCSSGPHDAIVAALNVACRQDSADRAVSMSKPSLTLQMPSQPDPVAVALDPATTALLVFDVIEHISARQPQCREQLVPTIAALLARARQAGVTVAYGT